MMSCDRLRELQCAVAEWLGEQYATVAEWPTMPAADVDDSFGLDEPVGVVVVCPSTATDAYTEAFGFAPDGEFVRCEVTP